MILDGKFFLVLVCLQMSPPSIWGAKKLKCKNPKVKFYIDYNISNKINYYQGDVGEYFYRGCEKKTCLKASNKLAIWSAGPAL